MKERICVVCEKKFKGYGNNAMPLEKGLCCDKCSNIRLGLVKWHPPWRHYCFFPIIEEEIVYSDRCLLSIAKFITELNVKHKGQLK